LFLILFQRLDVKITDLRNTINEGQRPLPLMTCVNVKADRSARSFQGMLTSKNNHIFW